MKGAFPKPAFAAIALLLAACASERTYSRHHDFRPAPLVRDDQMVGVFYCGDGLGINHTIILNSDHTFACLHYYCTGSDEPADGEQWFVRRGKQLVLKYDKNAAEELVFTIARIDGKVSFYDPQWESEITKDGATDINVFRRIRNGS